MPLAEAVKTTAQTGFPAIELACAKPHLNYVTALASATEIAGQIRDAGLAVSALSLFNKFTEPDDLKEQLKQAQTFIALAWLLHKPFPLVPIVGPHSKSELESCFQALALRLTKLETAWLNLEDRSAAGH